MARYSSAPTEHVHGADGHGNINTGYSRQMDDKTSESIQTILLNMNVCKLG